MASIPSLPDLARRNPALPGWRAALAAAALIAAGLLPLTSREAAADASIRAFRAAVPEAAVADLRRRIAATRWPDQEAVADSSQGVQLRKLQELVRYWGTDYDWRKAEAKLNALPQFVTRIDGLDIHFIHVRSRHANALPLIMTHGWPGSVFELLATIGPLTDPTAHGGRAEDAFHLVLPSIPGFGFSEKPKEAGWGPDRIARAWHVLMQRLGYARYVAQGGDWGAIIAEAMGRQAPQGLLGIHLNRFERATTIPPDIAMALAGGQPAPAHLTPEERAVFDETRAFYKSGLGYAAIMGSRPQTIGYALADSPVGLAAWFYEKYAEWVFTRGAPERSFTPDQMLDHISFYWLTNSGTSSARIYWENNASPASGPISIPVALSVFPGEIYQVPKSWAERAYRQLIYYRRVEKGGHFAAWEEPELFSAEVRAGFASLR